MRSVTPVQSERIGPVHLCRHMRAARGHPDLSNPAVARLHPIVIWMTDPAMRDYLDLPARPGDLLIIPAAGQVTVGGWVRNPGGFGLQHWNDRVERDFSCRRRDVQQLG